MNKIYDSTIDVELRQFYILAAAGSLGNVCGFISNIFIFGFSMPTYFCGICALIIIIASLLGILCGYYRQSTYIILALLSFIEFPLLFYAYHTSTIVYMILSIVGIVTFLPLSHAFIMSTLAIIADISIMIYSYMHPAIDNPANGADNYYSTITSLVIVIVCVFIMTTLTKRQNIKQADELKKLNDDIRYSAEHDALTDLYNRRYLNQYLEDTITDNKCNFYIALLDLDFFKKINDTYGHVFGDTTLTTFSNILKQYIEGKGIAARFGGEEFMLVFTDCDEHVIRSTLNNIRNDYKNFMLHEKQVEYSFSSGVEQYHQGTGISLLYSNVDAKLYISKQSSRDTDTF